MSRDSNRNNPPKNPIYPPHNHWRFINLFVTFEIYIHTYIPIWAETVQKERDSLFVKVFDDIMDMDSLVMDSNVYIPPDMDVNMLRPIFRTYLKVCLTEMGLRLVSAMQVKKKLVHRKQLMLDETIRPNPEKRVRLVEHQPSTSNAYPEISSNVSAPPWPTSINYKVTDNADSSKCCHRHPTY